MTGHRVFLIFMTIAILAVAGLGWLLGISPQLTAAATANTDAAAVQAENVAHQAKVVELKAQYDALPETRKKLKRLQAVIPDRQYLDRVADELAGLAAASSVVISAITVSEASHYNASLPVVPVPTTTDAPTDGSTAAPQQPTAPIDPAGVESKLYTLPVLITLVGTHDNIMAFVNACQLAPRLFLINSINMTAGTAAPASQASVAGFFFVYLDPAAVPYTTPTPSPSDTPTPSPSDTPTPAPTDTPTPEPTP